MPRPLAPPPVIEVDVDTSPEAQAHYLDALKILVRYIRERSDAKSAKSDVEPPSTDPQPELIRKPLRTSA